MDVEAGSSGTVNVAGREVHRIGYGLGGLTRSAADPAGFDAGVALLRHALDVGVQFYDTAEFYESGLANRLLAAAFADRRDGVCYATKVGARPISGPVPMTAAQRPDELREAVHQNLASLRTDRLDLVYLRRMDMTPGLVIADGDAQKVALADQLAELSDLRDEGLIGGIGLSHVTGEQLREALPVGVAAVSNIYNLVDRHDEDLLTVCEEQGIIWSPYFPLGGGGWAGLPRVVDDPVVQEVAQSSGATPNQVGLAWLLARSPQAMVIAGTSQRHHLDENVAAASLRLDTAALNRLDAVGAPTGS